MSDLASAIRDLLDQARRQGSRVVAIAAVEQLLGPECHQLHIRDTDGGWNIAHARACRDAAQCDVSDAVRSCLLVSSPHAVGRTYDVWLEDGALKFREVER